MPKSFSEQLRGIIEARHGTISEKQIADDADIARSTLNRFIRDVGPLNNTHIDQLFESLNLKICRKDAKQ